MRWKLSGTNGTEEYCESFAEDEALPLHSAQLARVVTPPASVQLSFSHGSMFHIPRDFWTPLHGNTERLGLSLYVRSRSLPPKTKGQQLVEFRTSDGATVARSANLKAAMDDLQQYLERQEGAMKYPALQMFRYSSNGQFNLNMNASLVDLFASLNVELFGYESDTARN